MDGLLGSIASAAIGGFFGAMAALFGAYLSQRARVDDIMRAERIRVYKPLWEMTGLLPRWPRSTSVSYSKLDDLSQSFRAWYFSEGGLFLSRQAREAYGEMQKSISELLVARSDSPEVVISYQEYTSIMGKLSLLRTELTTDLLSRKRLFR